MNVRMGRKNVLENKKERKRRKLKIINVINDLRKK